MRAIPGVTGTVATTSSRDVGDVSLVEGPARLGHQDEPIETVPACEQRPEREIARTPHDAQTAISARPRTDRRFGHRFGVDDRELCFAGSLLVEDEPGKDLGGELVGWGDTKERRSEHRIRCSELGMHHGPADQRKYRGDGARPRSASDADERDSPSGAVAGAVSRAVCGADRFGLHRLLHHAITGWLGRGEMASPTLPPLLDLGDGGLIAHRASSSSS